MKKAFMAVCLLLCGTGFAQDEAAVAVMNKQCGDDIAKYCAKTDKPLDRALCLVRHNKDISESCRAGLDEFFPCGESVTAACANVPGDKIGQCLVKNQASLAPKCAARLDTLMPCALEAEKFCGGAAAGNPVCLFDNIAKAGPGCAAFISEQYPCHAETAKYCHDEKTPSAAYDCLAANYGKLSEKCRQRRLPCAMDEKKLCAAEKTAVARAQCLKNNRQALSKTCKAAVEQDEKKAKMLTAYVCAESIAKFCKAEGESGDMDKVMECLERNAEGLAGQCKVAAIFAPACEADLDTYCSGMGGNKKTECVRKNEKKFAPRCQNALKLLRSDPGWKE